MVMIAPVEPQDANVIAVVHNARDTTCRAQAATVGMNIVGSPHASSSSGSKEAKFAKAVFKAVQGFEPR